MFSVGWLINYERSWYDPIICLFRKHDPVMVGQLNDTVVNCIVCDRCLKKLKCKHLRLGMDDLNAPACLDCGMRMGIN